MFEGAGIYAIYYCGDFPAYDAITAANKVDFTVPIYVGKADPKGGRQGGTWDAPSGTALRSRLQKHRTSFAQAINLDPDHFKCRYLVLEDAWIRLAERFMIYWYRPLWNVEVDGFGNNQPGAGRDKQKLSAWDTLHPGRTLAKNLPPSDETAAEVEARVRQFLATPIEDRPATDLEE